MAEESLNAFVMVTWVSLRSPEMGIVLECLTFSLAAGNDAHRLREIRGSLFGAHSKRWCP
jgi:hypothetical protein